jgi:hypothetical protein
MVPSIARTYDYLLGGKDNFAVDREIGDKFFNDFPGAVRIALDNRAALTRSISFLAADAGIEQFLDLGSGLPTAGNVHEVAQRVQKLARVVYVDNDPLVLAHARAMLVEDTNTGVVGADLRDPDEVLADPIVHQLIDFGRPMAVIASSILHHIRDEEDPGGIVAAFRQVMPPGSYLLVSHFRGLADDRSREMEEVLLKAFGRGVWRTTDQIAKYFEGLTMIEPGLVPAARWRPEDPGKRLTPWQRLIVTGVGRK